MMAKFMVGQLGRFGPEMIAACPDPIIGAAGPTTRIFMAAQGLI